MNDNNIKIAWCSVNYVFRRKFTRKVLIHELPKTAANIVLLCLYACACVEASALLK